MSKITKNYSKMGLPVFTFNGNCIDVENFTEDDIDIEAIATSLSRQSRYAGHSVVEWSVMQHLMLANMIGIYLSLPPDHLNAIICHDYHEFLIQDIIYPIKNSKYINKDLYDELADNVDKVLMPYFGVDDYFDNDVQVNVKTIDLLTGLIEMLYLNGIGKDTDKEKMIKERFPKHIVELFDNFIQFFDINNIVQISNLKQPQQVEILSNIMAAQRKYALDEIDDEAFHGFLVTGNLDVVEKDEAA